MKEKWNKKEKKGLEGERKRERGAAGCREVEAEEKRHVCQKGERWRGREQNTEYNYKEHESPKCQMTAGDSGEKGAGEERRD